MAHRSIPFASCCAVLCALVWLSGAGAIRDVIEPQINVPMSSDVVSANVSSELSNPFTPKKSGLVSALLNSFCMILATEIGDETFIVAALMSMRYQRLVVFVGAISALITMTVISTLMGVIVPNLMSRKATGIAAGCLYTFFGCRLMYIAYRSGNSEDVEEEIQEVTERLTEDQKQSGIRKMLGRFCTPVLIEAFVLTFLAEWGDRSQIATISMAAHENPWGVSVGAIAGHAICTGTACIGGELLARRISQRAVALGGGTLFFLFAIHQFVFEI